MSGRLAVHRLRNRLDATFARVPTSTADIETQADFAKYLCVLVSGFLENAIVAMVLDMAQRRSADSVAQFVERQLDYWTNPTSDKIIKLLGQFDAQWRIALEVYLVEERKEAVNSLVALRHKIAHGESVGTSLSQVKEYYTTVLDVVTFTANLLDPPVST